VGIIKIYLDTCIVIYLVEKHPQYSGKIEALISNLTDSVLCFSPLVRLESLVMPFRINDSQLEKLYETFFAAQKILIMPTEVFDKSARLRADFTGLKRLMRFILLPLYITVVMNFGQMTIGLIKLHRILSKMSSLSKNYA
jgi:predicted nucleic acid-binding protein